MGTEPSPSSIAAPAGRAVARLGRLLSHALSDVDLTGAQYRVLAMLDEGDAMASRIAGRMAVTKPSVTALVDGLVERGLVQRHEDPTDRRRRNLCITDAGVAALQAADEATTRRLRAIAEHHREDESAALAALAAWDDAIRGFHLERLARRDDGTATS